MVKEPETLRYWMARLDTEYISFLVRYSNGNREKMLNMIYQDKRAGLIDSHIVEPIKIRSQEA